MKVPRKNKNRKKGQINFSPWNNIFFYNYGVDGSLGPCVKDNEIEACKDTTCTRQRWLLWPWVWYLCDDGMMAFPMFGSFHKLISYFAETPSLCGNIINTVLERYLRFWKRICSIRAFIHNLVIIYFQAKQNWGLHLQRSGSLCTPKKWHACE